MVLSDSKTIEAVHVDKTHSGCYAGCIDFDQILGSAKDCARKLFGEAALLVIGPDSKNGKYPLWRHIVEITSAKACEPNERYMGYPPDGSRLVLIFFSDRLSDSCSNYIKELVDSIDWEKYAKNYWF